MSWIYCPKCGVKRSVETVISSAGAHNFECWNCGDPGWINPLTTDDPLEGRKDSAKLFTQYTFCPRNPYGESSREDHERQGRVHHFYEEHAYCTAIEAIPPDAIVF